MIVIPAEVGRVAGIEYGARIDLMIDSDVIPPRVAVVSGGDDLKVLRHGTSGSTLMVSGSRLKGFVPRMKTTVVGYEISSVDGRPSLIITLPLDVSKVKKATP